MTGFDAALLAIMIVSVGFAVLRGGLRELATLLALGIAAGAGLLLGAPIAGAVAGGSMVATLALSIIIAAIFFCLSYWGLAILIGRLNLNERQSLANRVGGGVFGLARALVLIGLGFVGYAYYMDEDQRPETVNNALLLPVAKASAGFIEGFAPARQPASNNALQPIIEETPISEMPEDEANAGSDAQKYDRNARANLNELVTTVTTSNGETLSAPTASDDPVAGILAASIAKNEDQN